MATANTQNLKRTFSQMDSVQDNAHDMKQETIKPEIANSSNHIIYQLPFRFNDEHIWSSLIPDIVTLIFNAQEDSDTITNDLQHSIASYLCKIGICIPCIYRICNKFHCISQQPNSNHLVQSLIAMEQKLNTSISNRCCFICNDIYLKLYQSLTSNTFFAQSIINEFEYQSYWMTLKIIPILTIRDFYIVHHLHHAIKSSATLITFPCNDYYDSHKDFLYFMIELLSKSLVVKPDPVAKNTYIGNKFINKFGQTCAGQIGNLGVNITVTFNQHYLSQYFNIATLEKDRKKSKTMTKQSKKRDRFRQWKNPKWKKEKREDMTQHDQECEEYVFMETFLSTEWKQRHYYLNNLKTFLLDLSGYSTIVDALREVQKEAFLEYTLTPWNNSDNKESVDVKIEIQRPPIFIAAEYNKYSREISQTPFAFAKSSILTLIVQQMRKWNMTQNDTDNAQETKSNDNEAAETKESTNRIMNPNSNAHGWIDIKQNIASDNIFGCDHVVFHSAGREDADVRMLGSGRPVLLQLMNPRKTISIYDDKTNALKEFEAFCNKNVDGMIALNNVRLVDEKYQEWMKSIENSKNKAYRCLCWISKCIESQEELDSIWSANDISYPLLLKQWTPIRVLHRRSLAERTKTLHDIKLKWISNQWISVDIVSEAGTYIKEFCNGDRGRTVPNLASLLKCSHANIITLDVIAVLT